MFRVFISALVACGLLASVSAAAAEPDWHAYQQLLARYVKPGERQGVALNTVDYSALKADPLWPKAVSDLETFPLDQLTTPREQLSFYINAYNILALKMVLDHWPLTSIKDAGHWYSPVWKKDAGTLGGKTVTLQQVEDDFLRSRHEPRIHMAIVCASISCPDLRTEPYRAATLDQQLDDQARHFLENTGKGLRVEGDTVHVSKIFHWFKDDFAADGGVEAFIRHYHPLPGNSTIDTDIDYNWNLNGT